MKKQNAQHTEHEILRQKAEEQLKKRQSTESLPSSETDNLKLTHELQVHQIELELQNEELLLAKERADNVAEKYIELYDFAPAGYFTLSKEGKILQLNLIGARMLGKERKHLLNQMFNLYVSIDTRKTFNMFIDNLVNGETSGSCNIILSTDTDNTPSNVKITGHIKENEGAYILTMIDISDLIKITETLQKNSEQIQNMNDFMVGRELRMVELKKEINTLLKQLGQENKYHTTNESE